MAKCPVCGARIRKNAKRCPRCGKCFSADKTDAPSDPWEEKLHGEPAEDTWTEEEGEILCMDEDTPWTGPQVPQLDVRPPEKKHLPVKILAFTVISVILILYGCWQTEKNKLPPIPGSGEYQGVLCLYEDDQRADLLGDWAELRPDGTIKLCLLGAESHGRWKLEGIHFTAELDNGAGVDGTLKNGILQFRCRKITYFFALPGKEGSIHIPVKKNLQTSSQEDKHYGDWTGEYYGCMLTTDGTGIWEGLEQSWDVCGQIKQDENGLGQIALWNSEDKARYRFCMAEVLFKEGTTDMGQMIVQWGKFYDMEMGPGEWSVDPGRSPVSTYPGMLYIYGRFVTPEDPQSTFAYQIFLRPWGDKWEDVASASPEELPISGMLPMGYESWYLPLVQTNQPMPEHF